VLLKNDGVLPLKSTKRIAIVGLGPAAGQIAAGFMGERGYGFEPRLISPLTALRRLAPDARIEYSAGVDLTGVPIPRSLLSGYDAERVVDPGTDYEWSGTLTVPTTGDYTLMVQAATGGGAEGGGSIAIDGKVAVRSGGLGMGGSGMSSKKWSSLLPTTDNRDNARAEIHLERGPHTVRFSAQSAGERPLRIRFAWSTPELRGGQIRDAVRIASRVRTPIVFAWRGSGPTLALPEDQDRLIEEVAAANPRTIVVLNSGGPVSMPWRDRVRAILEMWFPGQEGGWATARLLLGKATPSGKLPVAFPEAGFAFGYGLSYTTFDYSEVRVTRTPEGAQVRFKARCTGTKGGIATPQVYAGERLSGFTRLDLAPGEARPITLPISARSLSHWSAAKQGWVSAGGVPIQVR
jgi:beta-glucosidase